MSNSEAETTIVTVTLMPLPTWTAICTFMGFPIWVQSQHRCATACTGWPCFGVYGVSGLSVAPLFRLTERWPALRGLPAVALRRRLAPNFFQCRTKARRTLPQAVCVHWSLAKAGRFKGGGAATAVVLRCLT